MPKSCLIVGGGISGCVAALTLSKIGISCCIYEFRDTPATIGGAVNLTPNALRILKDLDVTVVGCAVDAIEIFSLHTGSRIGELGFRGPSGHALRIERSLLQKGLLDGVKKAGVKIVYGAKLVEVREGEGEENVLAVFDNGMTDEADFLIGCDGMYSAVRMNYVEQERKPIYTGVCTAYSIVKKGGIKSDIHFQQTAVNTSRYGPLMTSYTDPERTRIYLAAVMETAEQGSKEGWKARGLDHERTVKEVKRRYAESAFPCLAELIETVEEYIFYPVCRLEPGGKWSRGKVILLGDAAHGMPPQGESTGLAIEDSVLFARVLEMLSDKPMSSVFEAYEKTRRPRIDVAYRDAVFRWERVKDKTWLMQKLEEWFTLAYIWFRADAFEKNFAYDIRKEAIIE